MSYSASSSSVGTTINKVAQMIRAKGVARTGRVILDRLGIQFNIRVRGKNRTVELDGCTFPLRGVPDTEMKLQLLTGSYEAPERSAARRHINPESSVVELGGCLGVVACITNKRLNHPSRHVVLEANPLVIPDLQANRNRNQCSFTIVNRALAYDSKTVSLMPSPDLTGTSLYDYGDARQRVDVPATQLHTLIQDAQFDRFALICDVEGQEYALVKNELEVLRNAEVIIMELHPHVLGEDKVGEILMLLGTIGFQVSERAATVVVLHKT